jgi:hypothetical protein
MIAAFRVAAFNVRENAVLFIFFGFIKFLFVHRIKKTGVNDEESFNVWKFSPMKNTMITQNKLTPGPSPREERGGARRVTR